MKDKKTTDQVRTPPNPTGKGGFAEHPENRNPGGWKKQDTPRYKIERMMELSDVEILAIINDPLTPTFERKIATAMRDSDWRTLREMIHEVYGTPKQTVESNSVVEVKGATIVFEDKPEE